MDYRSYVGVTPDRDGVEWSPGRCKVFDDGPARVPRRRAGLAQRLFKIRQRLPSWAMAEATVDANYAAVVARVLC